MLTYESRETLSTIVIHFTRQVSVFLSLSLFLCPPPPLYISLQCVSFATCMLSSNKSLSSHWRDVFCFRDGTVVVVGTVIPRSWPNASNPSWDTDIHCSLRGALSRWSYDACFLSSKIVRAKSSFHGKSDVYKRFLGKAHSF